MFIIDSMILADIVDTLCEDGLEGNVMRFEGSDIKLIDYYLKDNIKINEYKQATERINQIIKGQHFVVKAEFDYFEYELDGEEAFEYVITIKGV